MPDVIRPVISSTIPVANTTGFSPYSPIYIMFSERMLESSITTANIGIYKDPLVSVALSLSYNDGFKMLTITPTSDLAIDTRYSVGISGVIKDLVGNTLGQDYWFNFWTSTPSGWIAETSPQEQPVSYDLEGYIEVSRTTPVNYSTNVALDSINPVRIYFDDTIAIGNRNYFGDGSTPNPLIIGNGFFEIPETTLSSYITVENQEVLGDPYIAHTAPTLTYNIRGTFVEVSMDGLLANNEYLFIVHEGIPGLTKNPLQEDYQFVFTSSYSPLYAGYNIVRLKVGPMLQMANAWVPNDTLNRFLYEASKEANRIHPTSIDPNNPPSYAVEFVIYQGTLGALYASLAIFAASGAGVRKKLADLEIEKDARGLMPAILPILEDIRKLRDEFMEDVIAGSTYGTAPRGAVKGAYDSRRPITNSSWRRLPMRSLQGGGQPRYSLSGDGGRSGVSAKGQAMENYDQIIQWIYTNEITAVNV